MPAVWPARPNKPPSPIIPQIPPLVKGLFYLAIFTRPALPIFTSRTYPLVYRGAPISCVRSWEAGWELDQAGPQAGKNYHGAGKSWEELGELGAGSGQLGAGQVKCLTAGENSDII